MEDSQKDDQLCLKIANNLSAHSDFHIRNNLLYKGSRIVLPTKLRQDIIEQNHNSPLAAHPGIRRTLQRIHRQFYWPRMDEDITQFVRTCHTCAVTKMPHQRRYEPREERPATSTFQRLAIDTFGPLTPSTKGNKYILVAQDMFTRYAFAKASPNNTSDAVQEFLKDIILTTTSLPQEILSDNGPPYNDTRLQNLCIKLGIDQKYAPAYHPQSNGLVERLMTSLRNGIVAYVSDHLADWDEKIPHIIFAYNTTPHSVTNETPYFLVFGRDPSLPTSLSSPHSDELTTTRPAKAQLIQNLQTAYNKLKETNELAQQMNRALLQERHQPTLPLQVGDLVWMFTKPTSNAKKDISAKLLKPWKGPYRIVSKDGDIYDLTSINSKDLQRRVHANRLRPYYVMENADILVSRGECNDE